METSAGWFVGLLQGCLSWDLLLGDESVISLHLIPDGFAIGSCQGCQLPAHRRLAVTQRQKNPCHMWPVLGMYSPPVADHRDWNNGFLCQRASLWWRRQVLHLIARVGSAKTHTAQNKSTINTKSHPYLKLAAYLCLLKSRRDDAHSVLAVGLGGWVPKWTPVLIPSTVCS